MAAQPTTQRPGVHQRQLGDLVITAASDGFVDLPLDAVRGIDTAEAARLVGPQPGAPGTIRTGVTMFALRGGGRTLLIDAGSDDCMGPSCGRLPDNLRAAGIEPAAVEMVVLTHIHPDHSGGLTSAAGAALFPNAAVLVHADDLAYVSDDAAMARADERTRTRYFEMARFRLAPYRDRLRTFRDGEVVDGITAVPCPGHTPGHCGFRVRSAGAELLILGDAVHVAALQVPQPDVFMMYDADGAQAARSRRAMLDLAARERLPVAGMHLPFPGFGAVTRDGDGFRLEPER